MGSRPNPGNHRYTIELSRREDRTQYDVHKLTEDYEVVGQYYIIVTTKNGQLEYTCSCPAYKSLCKHIHWAKKLNLDIQRDPKVRGVNYFPKEAEWKLRY